MTNKDLKRLKNAITLIYDKAKLRDKIEDFQKLNNESISESIFVVFKEEGLDIKKFLDMDYISPVPFKDSVWNKNK